MYHFFLFNSEHFLVSHCGCTPPDRVHDRRAFAVDRRRPARGLGRPIIPAESNASVSFPARTHESIGAPNSDLSSTPANEVCPMRAHRDRALPLRLFSLDRLSLIISCRFSFVPFFPFFFLLTSNTLQLHTPTHPPALVSVFISKPDTCIVIERYRAALPGHLFFGGTGWGHPRLGRETE